MEKRVQSAIARAEEAEAPPKGYSGLMPMGELVEYAHLAGFMAGVLDMIKAGHPDPQRAATIALSRFDEVMQRMEQ